MDSSLENDKELSPSGKFKLFISFYQKIIEILNNTCNYTFIRKIIIFTFIKNFIFFFSNYFIPNFFAFITVEIFYIESYASR